MQQATSVFSLEQWLFAHMNMLVGRLLPTQLIFQRERKLHP